MAFLYLLFAVAIFAHQLTRYKRVGIDTLTFIGAGFCVAYGIFPAYLTVADFDQIYSSFGLLFPYGNALANARAMEGPAFLFYVGAYILVCLGYGANRRSAVDPGKKGVEIFEISATFVIVVGAVLMSYYIWRLGGLGSFFSLAMYIRSDTDAIFLYGVENVAFLKNGCRIILAATILSVIAIKVRGTRTLKMTVVLVGSVIASSMMLVHWAGRLDVGMYVFGFAAAQFIGRKEAPVLKIVLAIALFSAFTAIGKELFSQLGMQERNVIEIRSIGQVVHRMMFEVGFPHLVTTTAMVAVPGTVEYRFFIDLGISIANLVPAVFWNYEKLRTLNEINTDLMNTGSGIPVDLVAFGYYNAGAVGVIIWSLFFGKLAGYLDAKFTDPRRVLSPLRSFVAITFGMRVLYSEPSHITFFSLHVILAVFVTLYFLWNAKYSRKALPTRRSSPIHEESLNAPPRVADART